MTPKRYTITLIFTDSNMPKMHLHSDKLDDIENQGARWLRQYASIKGLVITDRAEHIKTIFDGRGDPLFTVPVLAS